MPPEGIDSLNADSLKGLVLSLLAKIDDLVEQNKTLLFIGPIVEIPVDLQKEAFEFDMPLPGIEEMRSELASVLEQIESSGESVPELSPVEHSVVPDRIEAATFLAALGVAGGELVLEGARPDHMSVLMQKLGQMGMRARPAKQPSMTSELAYSFCYRLGDMLGMSRVTHTTPS